MIQENPLYPRQKIEQKKGETRLTIPEVFEEEFIRKVMPYQADLGILKPASCRKRMKQTIEQMVKRYG